MSGVSPSGRKYLLERPSRNEIEKMLCHMVVEARKKEEDFRRECKEKQEQWLRMERGFKEWEASLDRRERKIESHDNGMEEMMRDLRIREDQIVTKNKEREGLKNEVEEMVNRAKEDHDREFKVVKVILVCE